VTARLGGFGGGLKMLCGFGNIFQGLRLKAHFARRIVIRQIRRFRQIRHFCYLISQGYDVVKVHDFRVAWFSDFRLTRRLAIG
jgi:hypothetical protein